MEQGKRKGRKKPGITWHSAFFEAIKLELEEYGDILEFRSEHQLTAEPLRIDCVIIKKSKDAVIKKNIAVIFREINLLEYKSPDDYIATADFYKVYSYACLLVYLENTPVTGITISFVGSRYPGALLTHLREVRKYSVEESYPGIYNVEGDIFPIQIINSRRLSANENLWLKDLRYKLAPWEIHQVISEIHRKGKKPYTGAYLDAITRANNTSLWEVIKMRKTHLSLEEILEEAGWLDKWEAKGKAIGEESKAIDIAQKMLKSGFPFETIVSITDLAPEKIKALH